MKADTRNGHLPRRRALDPDPHGFERFHGRQTIFSFKKASHLGDPLGKRSEHNRAMGNGFIAWHSGFALKRAAGLNLKSDLIVMHAYFST